MTKKFILTALAASMLLAGCSLIPTYERPAAPVPTTYPGDPAQPQGQAAANLPWQDFFTDPRLAGLIRTALANNRDLRVSVLNIEQARAQFQIERSNLFPALGLTGTGSRSSPNAYQAIDPSQGSVVAVRRQLRLHLLGDRLLRPHPRAEGPGAGAVPRHGRDPQGGADQPDRVGGQRLAHAAGRRRAAGDHAPDDGHARRVGAPHQDALRQRRVVGARLPGRELAAGNGARSYAQQQRTRLQDENALALLLGAPVPAEATAGGAKGLEGIKPMPDVPAGLPSDLLAERPDIRSAEQQLIAANANIGAARANFFPRVSLTSSIGTASSEFSGLFDRGSKAWSFAPTVTLPIFDAGRNIATLDSAKAGREIAVAQYEKSIQTAFREVADALAGRATLGEQVRAQRAQADAEAVRFKLSDLRYRNGIASALDLLDAQRSLFTAQQSAVTTRLLQLQNQVTLYKTLGGGWATRDGGEAAGGKG